MLAMARINEPAILREEWVCSPEEAVCVGCEFAVVLLPLDVEVTLPVLEVVFVLPEPELEFVFPATELEVAFAAPELEFQFAIPTFKAVTSNPIVLLPTTNPTPEASKLITVPFTVTPGPPAEIPIPAIENPVGFGVKTWLPIVTAFGVTDCEGNVIVLLPSTNPAPEGCSVISVPAMVTPGPPAEMVVPAIENAVGFGVKTSFPTVTGVKPCAGPPA